MQFLTSGDVPNSVAKQAEKALILDADTVYIASGSRVFKASRMEDRIFIIEHSHPELEDSPIRPKPKRILHMNEQGITVTVNHYGEGDRSILLDINHGWDASAEQRLTPGEARKLATALKRAAGIAEKKRKAVGLDVGAEGTPT